MEKEIHILVIRLSAMGDVAMSVPVLRAFALQHPTVKITFLSKPFLAPLFEDIPNLQFYGADVKGKHKGVSGLFALYKQLKKSNITHIADFHNVLRSKILRTFFRLSGLKVAFIDKGRAEKKALTRPNNKVFKQLKTSHERYVDVLQKLGFVVALSDPVTIQAPKIPTNILNVTGSKSTSWVGIAPFAAFEGKKYPLPLMEKVISLLSKKDIQLLLFGGGAHEVKLLQALDDKYPNTLSVAGKFSLREELIVISHLDVMISMDSGNAHLSAMQQIKTITLWGVTHPYAGFAPFHQPEDYCLLPDLKKYPKIPCSVYGNKVCPGYENVMETITPEVIVAKVEDVLKS